MAAAIDLTFLAQSCDRVPSTELPDNLRNVALSHHATYVHDHVAVNST